MNIAFDWHQKQYPQLQSEDRIKLVFQACLGCGHLLASEDVVTRYITQEMHDIPSNTDEPLTDPLSEAYLRLNLRPAKALGLKPEWIARLMRLSDAPSMTREDTYRLALSVLPDNADYAQKAAQILDTGWLPNHSAIYRNQYAPAYRVLSTWCEPILQILAALASSAQTHTLITIDGPCGSGKSTLAALLAEILQAPVVHTDDFVIPHARKTPEQLAIPGGNEDADRLAEEFVRPWTETGHAVYSPYSWSEDRLTDSIEVPAAPFAILEGSYSNLPVLAAHASVRIFLSIDRATQLERLEQRESPQSMAMFRKRWIPLEDAYLKEYHLPDSHCLVIPAISLRLPQL